MTARLLTAYFLVLLLVSCPYFCLAESPGTVAGVAAARPCSHCNGCSRSGDRAPTDRAPTDDRTDTGCGNCLCHGAVFYGWKVQSQQRVESPESRVQSRNALALYRCLRLCSTLDSGLWTLDSGLSCHFPPYSTGREICALISSRLL